VNRRVSIKRYRVLARIQAHEDRAQWEDAKWQRLACFALDLVGGVGLGVALGLAAFLWALTKVAA
jgi:hypothetical protein